MYDNKKRRENTNNTPRARTQHKHVSNKPRERWYPQHKHTTNTSSPQVQHVKHNTTQHHTSQHHNTTREITVHNTMYQTTPHSVAKTTSSRHQQLTNINSKSNNSKEIIKNSATKQQQ